MSGPVSVVDDAVSLVSRVQFFVTPWTVAHKAPLSMGFPRQEYWRGLPFPPPGDLTDPGTEPTSPALAGRPLLLSHQESSYVWLNKSKICHVCTHIYQLE